MLRPDVKMPGRGDGAGVGEAVSKGIDGGNPIKQGRIGRGLRAYEAAKQKLLTLGLSSDEYRAACRQAADAAGV